MRRLAFAAAPLPLLLVLIAPAWGDSHDSGNPSSNCLSDCNTNARTVVEAQGDRFGIEEQRRPSDRVPGRGAPSDGEAPGRTTWTSVAEHITPTCSTNGLLGGDGMCMGALTYCGDGRVGYWVWHRLTTYTRGPDGTVTEQIGPWRQEDGAYCLGGDDPQLPTIGKVLSWVQDHFSSLGIAPAGVTAAPAPRTLVNIETRLSAGSAAPVDIAARTPWSAVTVHAKPLRWRWTFGDGTQSPPMPTPDITHVYRQARLHLGVRVEVEWGGTFSVAGDPASYPIIGTALVRSADTTVDVRQARSELVSR